MTLSELQERWLKALESGDYTQTKGRLRDDTGFCCLGVLCDLVEPGAWYSYVDSSTGRGEYSHNDLESAPAVSLMSTFGLDEEGAEHLIGLNDSKKFSFEQIAAEVRANPERYFTTPKGQL